MLGLFSGKPAVELPSHIDDFFKINFEEWHSWMANNKGLPATIPGLEYAVDHPDEMAQLDYGRFMERVTSYSRRTFRSWSSEAELAAVLFDLHAVYIGLAAQNDMRGPNILKTYREAEFAALPIGLKMMSAIDPMMAIDYLLNSAGLSFDDLEKTIPLGQRIQEGYAILWGFIRNHHKSSESMLKQSLFFLEFTPDNYRSLLQRVSDLDISSRKKRNLLNNLRSVAEDYRTDSSRLAEDVDSGLGYVKALLKGTHFYPFQPFEAVLNSINQDWLVYKRSERSQALVVRYFAGLIHDWQPVQEHGRYGLLKGYEQDLEKAREFETGRYLTMRTLAELTMQAQDAIKRIEDACTRRWNDQISLLDGVKFIVTPESIQAYKALYASRMMNIGFLEKDYAA